MLSRFKGFDNRFEMIIGRAFFRGTSVQVHRVGDVQMIVDHRFADAGSVRGLISSEMYRGMLKKVSLPRTLRVLDVGANVGGFPLLLSSLGHKFDSLTCIEMNPATAVRLHFNILSNWPNAKVVNAAVTSECRDIEVRLGGGDTGDSLELGSPNGTGTLQTIHGVRLDDIAAPGPIDILKMDIEGAEEDVLLKTGHEDTLARSNVLVIEIHHERSARAVHQAIEKAGFRRVEGPRSSVGQFLFSRA